MTTRSLLLSTLVTLLHGWTCAQTINLQVSAIPSTATRVVAVVDQGGLAAPIRFSQDVTAGALSSTLSLAVPAGGPYRVRAIAFTAGLAYPAILRSGKSAGLYVPNLTAVAAQITLAGLNAALEASTPLSAPAGATVALAASVSDPGDAGAGASAVRVYYLTTALAGNQQGDEQVGPLERLAEGVYRLSVAMSTPPVGATLSYQFAYNAWDFNDANQVEQPYWFWPNLSAGGVPLTLAAQGSSSISVAVSNLPAAGRRIVAVVDGEALQRPVRVVKDYLAGQTSSTLNVDVPAGSGYRVRVVAFTPGSLVPAILRTGKATALAAPGTAAVALADPAFTLSSGTPASAPAGSTLSLEVSLTDPGDVAAGMPVASVFSRTTAFTANLDGTEWRGLLEGLGVGIYRFSVPVALPASAATTYYQFATSAFEFNDPSGRESPQLCWPNLQAGQALRQIASTLSSSIRITISGTPASATRLIAVVDQGGLTRPVRAVASFTAGQPPASITVGVPPGGPYRVRLIALKSGLSTPTILRSGKVASVTVAASATAAAAVTLVDYTAALDAAMPVAGTAGGMVTVIVNVTDPGETASGAGASRLYGATAAFAQNLSVAPIIGLLEKSPGGTMKLTTPVVLPGGGGVFYFQVAYEAQDFSDADGVERPYFCWPNLEAAQALKQITANANPSLYTLSGKVTRNGVGLSGVTVSLSGTRTGSVVTGADGAYSFDFLPAGSYTVSAARSNFTISPGAAAVTLAGNQTVNFTAVQIGGTIGVTVSGLPAAGNRIVAVVDGGTLAVPLRVVQGYVAGQSAAVLNVDVPAVGGYRIRVVAFAGGGVRPVILRAGQVNGVAAPSSATVTLADPTFTPLTGTAVSAPAGSTVSLDLTIGDPGSAVAGVAVGSVYGQAQPFAANLSGAEARGALQSVGTGSYRITVPLVLPGTAATTYYQFAANAIHFNDPLGTESPYYVWPDVQAGQVLRQIAATLPTAIRILVSGVPATATRLIAVVDQGALAQPVRTVVSFAAGQAPGSVTVGVPIGSGYRVRVIAIRAGAATPSILRSGKATGVSVPANATTDAAVVLGDYAVALDPAMSSSGPPGGQVTVIANASDPGETAYSLSIARLYSSLVTFTENLAAAAVTGVLQKNGDGTLKLTAPVTLPGQGGALYYQLAYEAVDFGDAGGVERPYFCWPNLELGQVLNQVAAYPVFTLSGKVTLNGVGLSGVTVSLSGTRTGSVVTGADGAYSFDFLPAGSYTVSAARSNFTISPRAAAVTLAANQTVNFAVVQIAGAIGVTVSGLPPAGNRIVALVDGGTLAVPLRVVQGYAAGQTSTVLNVDVPAVGGYRVRVVAFTDGGGRPAILRAGQVNGVAAPSSTAVTLADPTFTPLVGTPVSAPAGSRVSLELTIGDPGNALAGVAAGSVYGQSQPFTANLSGAEARGVLQNAGTGSYRLTVPLVLPGTAVTTHYQFTANAFDFNDPSGAESLYYVWPDVQARQALRQIAATLPAAIRILVSGVPATATRLIAVVDQGALAQPIRTVANFAAGQTPGSITVAVPLGSGYRVRVIAIRAGAATPSILRSGKAVGVSVPASTTADAAVPLADYTVTLDPATPSSAPAGTTVHVIANVIDQGDTALGAINPGLYGATTVSTQNLSAAVLVGQLTDSGNGAWAFTAPVVLPSAGGVVFYYQIAYEAADFSDAGGEERPYFCWPNLEAAQVLRQIVVDPVFTISGKVTLSGTPLAKVTVSLSGLKTGSVVTGTDGAYAFTGLPAGAYTLAAARTNFTFAPASSALTLAGNRTVNFSVAQVTGTVGVSRTVLRFGATLGGAAATTTQEIVVDISDNLPVSWAVVSDKAWLRVTPATGTGSGVFTVSLNQAALPTSGIWPATLTLTTNTSTSAKIVIQVYLAVSPATGAPFGAFETPAGGTAVLASSVPVTGWALDDVGVKKVQVWREPVGREGVYPNGLVYIGDAIFVPDARPDVASMFGDKPNNYRAGWGYLMLTNFLPNATGGPAGNGTYKIHAIAVDEEGRQTELGVKTITVNNAKATKPFGTIDAPGPGEVVSGASYGVTGWALTPQPYKVDESGKDMWIIIDGVWLGNVSYNFFRSDVANLFPSYANANGSAGNYSLDTTKLANGMHSIAWVVADVAGRTDGIGSRYFFVRNAVVATQAPQSPPAAAAAVEASMPARPAVAARAALGLTPVTAGGGDIEIEELGHVALQLPRGLPWRGRMLHNEDLVPLPVGSTLESETGVFLWQLGPGFLGQYVLEFDNGVETRTVRVIVRPMGSTGNLTKEGQVGF